MTKNNWLLVVLVGAVVLLAPGVAKAKGQCFCGTDLSNVSAAALSDEKLVSRSCVVQDDTQKCVKPGQSCVFYEAIAGGELEGAALTMCKAEMTKWDQNRVKLTAGNKGLQAGGAGKSSFIPQCLLEDTLSDSCRDVSIFVYFGINVAKYLFTIVGALALIMFVYGGFMLILSQGSSEKVKKGTEIIVASVIGLVIVFGAYMLVSFLSESIGVQNSFKLK